MELDGSVPVCMLPQILFVEWGLWMHLSFLTSTITGPWLVMGDFNETILPSDQRGGIFNHQRAIELLQVMENCNLVDLTTTGG